MVWTKGKLAVLALIAILLAFIAFDLAQQAFDNNSEQIIVNNTNLAPTIEPAFPGTGERVSGVVYFANNYSLDLYAFAHASSVSQTASVSLYINGVLVEPSSGRPLGVAEEANRSVHARIPKGANYTVMFLNYHHYEWREYPVLTGRNGTLSINLTNITNIISGGGGVSFDGNPVNLNGSTLYNGSNQLGTFNHSNLTNLLSDDHPQYAKTQNQTDYYVELTGSDTNNCVSLATACRTFNHIWSIIGKKNLLSGNVRIFGGNGTFYEFIDVPAVFFNGFNITMYGQTNQTDLGAATTGSDTTYGPTGDFGHVFNTSASWTTNAYKNMLLLNPSGQMAVIAGNNATAINYSISSTVYTKFSVGQSVKIVQLNTTIECAEPNLQAGTRFGCAYLAPNAKLFLDRMRIVNNITSQAGNAVYGDFETQIYARYSYIEGFGNAGSVQLLTQSYLKSFNSVFVGDGAIIRLEKGSVLFDRNSASNYIMKSTTQSFKTGIFLELGCTSELNEGWYIDGITKASNSNGMWALDGSSALALNGFVNSTDTGLHAQRNAIITEVGLVKYINTNNNFIPTTKIDNSSIQ